MVLVKMVEMVYNNRAKKTRTLRLHSQRVICYNRLSHPWCGLRVFLADSTKRVVTRDVFISTENLPTMKEQRAYLHNYRRVWTELISIFGENCVYCHKQPSTQIDHVIPYSYIRTHMMENLRPCCAWCNLLASNKVFEGFEEKYEYLREKRYELRNRRDKALTCSQCLIPYYSAMHNHPWLCPVCYDREYATSTRIRPSWKKWIATLSLAGFEPKAHFNLGEHFAGCSSKPIVRAYRISLLVEYYAVERGQSADEIIDLVAV